MKKAYSKRILIGAILFIAASTVYLSAEAIAAQAWSTPEYRYSFHYISDLGVSKRLMIDGREVFSPLAVVMNTGFVLYGILSASSYIAVLPMVKNKAKWLIIIFALIQGTGNMLVGLFPGESYDYASTHIIGAGMSIIGGNITLILIGLFLQIKTQSHWTKVSAMLLGILGLIALTTMLTNDFGYPAVFERLSVYTMTLWNLLFGVWLIRRYKKRNAI